MTAPLPTAEFEKWIGGREFRGRVERITARLVHRFGVTADPNNYWDLHQEITAKAVEVFRRGERPLDTARTDWLRKLAYRTASEFASEHKKLAHAHSFEEILPDTSATLGGVVSDERERFTRAYLRRKGGEFYAREIDRLPPMYQQAILLVDVEGRNVREAAKAAQVPYRTMVSRHTAAQKLLAKRLAEYLDDMTREPE